MRQRLLIIFSAMIAVFTIAGPMAASAEPVDSSDPGEVTIAAYRGDVATVRTTNCPCTLRDPWDGMYLEKDVGGEAVRIIVKTQSGRIAGKVEFHPYGEYLYVYDTYADGVSIRARVWSTYYSSKGAAPHNLSFPEGARIPVELVASNGTRLSATATA